MHDYNNDQSREETNEPSTETTTASSKFTGGASVRGQFKIWPLVDSLEQKT